MSRGCVRASFRDCGVEDLVRGFADGHLCVCEELVSSGIPLFDGEPAPWLAVPHPKQHRCGECGRTFTLEVVDVAGLPGAP